MFLLKKCSKVLKTVCFFILIVIFASCLKQNSKYFFKKSFYVFYNIIKENHIEKDNFDWSKIEKKVTDSIPVFKTNIDVTKAINYVFYLIEDEHSFFLYAKRKSKHKLNFLINDSIVIPKITHKVIRDDIGYMKILGFAANDSLSLLYSRKIQKAIHYLDKNKDLSGWIIDLRNNKGGLAGTISLGLSDLYKDSIIGYSLEINGNYLEHKLIKGVYSYGNQKLKLIDKNELKNKNKPIVVLVNQNTASMGEFVAESFKFQEGSIIIGEKTAGLTTNLKLYSFSDKTLLGVATSYMLNKNREKLKDGVTPDISCLSKESLKVASDWIKNR
ncbi:S41 family peptidase [Polaribacter aquimarinus]|uniref:Tail specific protease domain-containing protein n=1 Tax=Polaribacter aquimarinus TaxID=2100726 RepID=A0A2U2JB60_9FLAO|nr:S41 family peptidase [Polaribacter aquimarinus]PWG05576.1 hypothetical protein DIS07_03795 [Polaribacter aquimarinus]